MAHLGLACLLACVQLSQLSRKHAGDLMGDVLQQKYAPVLALHWVVLGPEQPVFNVNIKPTGEKRPIRLQDWKLADLLVFAGTAGHVPAERLTDPNRHS